MLKITKGTSYEDSKEIGISEDLPSALQAINEHLFMSNETYSFFHWYPSRDRSHSAVLYGQPTLYFLSKI